MKKFLQKINEVIDAICIKIVYAMMLDEESIFGIEEDLLEDEAE